METLSLGVASPAVGSALFTGRGRPASRKRPGCPEAGPWDTACDAGRLEKVPAAGTQRSLLFPVPCSASWGRWPPRPLTEPEQVLCAHLGLSHSAGHGVSSRVPRPRRPDPLPEKAERHRGGAESRISVARERLRGGMVTRRRRRPLPREGGGERRLHPRRVWGPWLGHEARPGKPPAEGPALVTYCCGTQYGSPSATEPRAAPRFPPAGSAAASRGSAGAGSPRGWRGRTCLADSLVGGGRGRGSSCRRRGALGWTPLGGDHPALGFGSGVGTA